MIVPKAPVLEAKSGCKNIIRIFSGYSERINWEKLTPPTIIVIIYPFQFQKLQIIS